MPGSRRLAATADLTLGPVVAVAVAVFGTALAERLPIPAGSNVALALTASGGAVVAALLAAAVWTARPVIAVPLTWAGLAAIPAVPLSLFLANTPHYLFGVSGDQQFRVQFLTRFADSARLADFAYADLPPYYPAAWFWVGGRAAALAGVDAWEFHKVFSIATLAVTAVLAYALWALVTTRRRALGAAVATTLAGLATLAAYTPYSWLTGALVPPLAVLGLRLVRRTGSWLRTAVLVGLVLGLAAVTHTQILIFAGFVLTVLAADGLLTRWTRPVPLLVTVGVVLAAALPLTLVHWLPYLLASAGEPTYSAGQHFLAESGSRWPLPMLEATALGGLCLAGTVWIVARFGRSTVARALGVTVACGYAWYLLSTLALTAGTTLLAFRIEPVIAAALASGAVGAAAEVVHRFRTNVPGSDGGAGRPTPTPDPRARPRGERDRRRNPTAAVVTVLAAVAVVAQVQTVPETYEWAGAAQDYRPDGTKPDGSRDPGDANAWLGELRATIDGLTGRAPREVVVASANQTLLTYTPYFSWQASSAQYANPLANYPARTDELRRWTTAAGPAQLLGALEGSPARAPSVFVFSRTPDGLLQLPTTEDRFPDPDSGAPAATFAPQLFDDPAWQRRDVGPYAVLVRVPGPPVP
ncbi:galactan 5-O-arabinofuranosyltransferase [Pseudonocardia ammonioxydans]|uniref:Galactan 5-O-arabinofuranosyltransferase n=1 Tax=Pseudonocardia ammonioxydans TaxID=260086 RepID=A0A1I4WS95_PSUAM|nr:arabinofuranosyltransferase [Pseudonocardia ammonioxydans]SFN16327.1 galactan 5-O-arabinofuranosyltransferase [Pseudonocardia ammonioxydans]